MSKERKFEIVRKMYWLWPLLFLVPAALLTVVILFHSWMFGIVTAIVTVVYAVGIIWLSYYRKRIEYEIHLERLMQTETMQGMMLERMPIPFAIFMDNGDILWQNGAFRRTVADNHDVFSNITEVLGGAIGKEDFPQDRNGVEKHFRYVDRHFLAKLVQIHFSVEGEKLSACFLTDETETVRLIKENKDQRLVQGLIYVDNYEEVMHGMDDVRKALLTSLVERRIRKYFQSINGVVQNFDKDKYYVLIQYKYLNRLQSNKFDILEDVKKVNVGNNSMPLTLSMGFGDYSAVYQESYEAAVAAVDLALARGGDQAVVRSNDKVYYYGGRSKTVEKNTRVKARVKAHALRSVFEGRDKVMVMGHRLADIDCVGAGIGVYTIARMMNKEVHICLGEVISSVRPSVERFIHDEGYPEDMFVSPERAMELIDHDTTLVVVDVNKPAYTEVPELIPMAGQVVVIDHHRQGSDVVQNPVLSYVEPYASSTCEMITEILQYIVDPKARPDQKVIDALYSGILIDTNYFANNVGVRTFEAAAWLRRNGADLDGIRKMLRDDEERFKAKAQTISDAKSFLEGFVISTLNGDGLLSPTELGAQAANELLNISGVKASFVLTKIEDTIFISARSIDEVNVQVIMERLGGGGHQTVAGAQLKNTPLEDAKDEVIALVKSMLEEGDI